ncbi:MAG: helix-turn-helix domain-containing protein [Acidiferrobacterales bacterium]
MSITALSWAWGLRLNPNVKLVLMAWADACDDDGYCWPRVPALARKTSLNDRSVQRILNQLKAGGWSGSRRVFTKMAPRTAIATV